LSERTSTTDADNDVDRGDAARIVKMRDECDPASFNAAIGPNTCVRNGSITFDHFVAELTKTQRAAQWRFVPSEVELDPGANLFAVNNGGEVHTFTRVAKFGGGIVGFLNDLTGNTTVAPECTTLEPDDFVAAGATYTADLSTDEIQHFQCCIHPWMRADVHLKHHS
jgi:plastocyanin